MTQPAAISPICAFDVFPGNVVAVTDHWPQPTAGPRASYRWIHFDLATPGIERWFSEFVPATAAKAMLQEETRPRCDPVGQGLIVNLRGVNLNPQASPEDMVSVRLWITAGSVISVQARTVYSISAIRESADNGTAPADIGAFVSHLAYIITKRIESVSLDLDDKVDELEDAVISRDALDGTLIGQYRQTAIKLRRFVNPQRDALETLGETGISLLGHGACELIRETENRTRRAFEELEMTRERLVVLQEHLNADRALRLSRNSQLLSVIAAIFLPLGFITGLFGVNLAGIPGARSPYAFALLGAFTAVLGIGLLYLFKRTKWL